MSKMSAVKFPVINVNLCLIVTSMDCVVNLVNQIAFILKGIDLFRALAKHYVGVSLTGIEKYLRNSA